MIKRSVLALFIVLLFSSNQVGAQDVNIISGNQSNQPVQTAVPDTFPLLDLEETELDKSPTSGHSSKNSIAATHHPPHRVRTCFAF